MTSVVDWKRLAVWAVCALSCLWLTSCNDKKAEAAKKEASAGGAAPSVVVATVEQKTIPVMNEYIGRTLGTETVDLMARVEGFLMEAPFQEGSVVRKGQVLFRIDPRVYQAKVQSAKAQLSKAEVDLERARDNVRVDSSTAQVVQAEANLNKANQDVKRLEPLAKEMAVPQQDLDDAVARQKVASAEMDVRQSQLKDTKLVQTTSVREAQAGIEAAKAALQQAELDLSYCTVSSPIDGIVGTRLVDVGNLVGRGQPTKLSTVSTVNPIKVTFAVAEAEYLTLARRNAKGAGFRGQSVVDLYLADNTKYPQKGKLTAGERTVDEKTGTLQIQSEFPNPTNLIRPGQFARIQLPVGTLESALLIPQRAVSDLQSAKVVYVVGADNKVQLRTVQLGPRYEGRYVISEGLKPGERIIVEGFQKARPGAPVNATEQPVSAERK